MWNTDWLTATGLIIVAQTIAHSAIERKESRGAHQRLDGFEQRDDKNFPQALRCVLRAGADRIAYAEVKITKSPPAARVYGAAGEKLTRCAKASMFEQVRPSRNRGALRYKPESDEAPHSEVSRCPSPM